MGMKNSSLRPECRWQYPRIAPDGLSVAVDVEQNPKRDVWLIDALHPTVLRPFTIHPDLDQQPVYSHDGRLLLFASNRHDKGKLNIYRQAADGSGAPERLFPSPVRQIPHVYPGADQVLLVFDSPGTGIDIGLLTLGQPNTFLPLLQSPSNELNPQLSPNKRWLVYQSEQTGNSHIYVRPFPDVERKAWRISSTFGKQPRWSRDGKELFFLGQLTNDMYRVRVRANMDFAFDPEEVLFANRNYATSGAISYDIAKDGRFLMVKNPEPAATERKYTSSSTGLKK